MTIYWDFILEFWGVLTTLLILASPLVLVGGIAIWLILKKEGGGS